MNTLTVHHILLVTHLAGLVLMAGTTVAEFVAFRTSIDLLKTNRDIAAGLLKLLSTLTFLLAAGGALLIISGAGLLLITGGGFLHQLWLQLKLALVVLLASNGMLIGSPQLKKLKGQLAAGREMSSSIGNTISNLNIFHAVQVLLFFAIVVLAVFKVR